MFNNMEDIQDAIDRRLIPGMRNLRGPVATQRPPNLPADRKLKGKVKVDSEGIEMQPFKPWEGAEDVESTSSSRVVRQSEYPYGKPDAGLQGTEHDTDSEEGHRAQASPEIQEEYPLADTLQHLQTLGRKVQWMTKELSNRRGQDSSNYSSDWSSSDCSPKQNLQELEPKYGILVELKDMFNTFALRACVVLLILGIMATLTIFIVLAVPLWMSFTFNDPFRNLKDSPDMNIQFFPTYL